ncbi:MAG: T9SS type A sorting domain-containing protein [Ignavibacteriaceae bacterium]
MNSVKSINHDEMIPLKFHLSQNYPNPFIEKTTIKYCVPYKTEITITVYNSNGMLIDKLLKKEQEAGTYEIEFNGSELPEGIYYCHLKACDYFNTKKMTIKY